MQLNSFSFYAALFETVSLPDVFSHKDDLVQPNTDYEI